MIDPKTRVIAIVGSVALLVGVIELVRRRRMKEEYSVLWTLTSLTLLVMAIVPDLLSTLTTAIGAVLASSTLFFTGLIFALLMLLHFSVRISSLERSLTALVQELGLMTVERDHLRRELERPPRAGPPAGPPADDEPA
jgi:hypothetical protein